MTDDFRDLIYLFACGAKGIKPVPKREMNFQGVFNLAVTQGIWQIVFLSVKKLYESGEISMREQEFRKYHNLFLESVMKNVQRQEYIKETLRLFSEHGINYALLKGEVLSLTYAEPSSRISSDTDILINTEDEKTALSLLKSMGYQVKVRDKNHHHSNCYHEIGGLLELHIASMGGQMVDELFFDNAFFISEPYRNITIWSGQHMQTLGVNDGLIFVTFHFIKHFLFKGAGIRQLMDVLNYISYYKEEINWDNFAELLKHLKYDKFIDACLKTGIKYLHFKKEDFRFISGYEIDNSILEHVLSDMEEGGIFGNNEEMRNGFNKYYVERRFYRFKSGNINEYMNEAQKLNLIKFTFDKQKLQRRYAYSQNHPWMLPIAFMHRVINLLISICKGQKTIRQFFTFSVPNKMNQVVERRIELIEKLDMI